MIGRIVKASALAALGGLLGVPAGHFALGERTDWLLVVACVLGVLAAAGRLATLLLPGPQRHS